MKIETEIFILKREPRKNNRDNSNFLILSLADNEGNVFDIITNDMSYLELQPFNKYRAIFSLRNNSKYGLSLNLESVEK